MTVITLARALKLKNRLAGQLSKLGGRAVAHNSNVKGAVNPYNSVEVFEEYEEVQAKLVEVKTSIQLANASIVRKIIEIGETRSQISLLQGINVTEGPVHQTNYGNDTETVREYEAAIGAAQRDVMIAALELDIDNLQDDIDSHNATMQIDLTFDL
jgi:hypothetical protein